MSGQAVFIGSSVLLIFAYTAYMIWVMRKRTRLMRELQRLLDEANSDPK
jgi:hypothetical protein